MKITAHELIYENYSACAFAFVFAARRAVRRHPDTDADERRRAARWHREELHSEWEARRPCRRVQSARVRALG